MAATVEIWDADAPWLTGGTLLHTCTSDADRHAIDVLNDVGSVSFETSIAGPDDPWIVENRIIKLRDGTTGKVLMSGRIGPFSQTTVATDEETGENMVVACDGSLAILDDARVLHHPLTPTRMQIGADARTFGFASLDYTAWTAAPWVAATALYKQNDPTAYAGGRAPANWPDPDAYWIWSRPAVVGPPPMPVGTSYFRTTVTLAEGDYSMWIAADDGYKLWIDGIKVDENIQAFGWQNPKRIDRFFTAGTHTIAIEGINIARTASTTNVAGVLFTLASLRFGGAIDTVYLRSDSSWMTLDYPATPPGLTATAIARVLVDEAQSRGALWAIHGLDFTDTVDSLGNAVTVQTDKLLSIGRTLTEVVKDLASDLVDLGFDHDQMKLRMVNKGAWNTGPAVAFTPGVDVFELHQENDPRYATDAYTKLADGSFAYISSGLGTPNSGSDPIKETYVSAGTAESVAQATSENQGLFDRVASSVAVCTGRIDPSAGKEPVVNWWPGKAITLPARGGGTAPAYVQHIEYQDRSTGDDGEIGGTQEVTFEALQ